MSFHARQELEEDSLWITDLESSVLTGAIIERQRDRSTDEWKYVIEGRAPDGLEVTVVAKWDAVDRMVIVTVFRT